MDGSEHNLAKFGKQADFMREALTSFGSMRVPLSEWGDIKEFYTWCKNELKKEKTLPSERTLQKYFEKRQMWERAKEVFPEL